MHGFTFVSLLIAIHDILSGVENPFISLKLLIPRMCPGCPEINIQLGPQPGHVEILVIDIS